MINAAEYLLHIIRNEIFKDDGPDFCDGLSENDWLDIYKLAKIHDVNHFVADYALSHKCLENGELHSEFKRALLTAVYRCELSVSETWKIKESLEKNNINFVLLKGAVLREYYPEPWMRTSADIDVLVKEEDLECAKTILSEHLGCLFSDKKGHDVSGVSDKGVNVELHYRLYDARHVEKRDAPLMDIWDDCAVLPDISEMKMNSSAFYYYHFSHMAKHVALGGCGIRPIIDTAIMERSVPYDENELDALLNKGGIYKFSQAISSLKNAWFDNGEYTELTKKLEKYILYGGAFGTEENKSAALVAKSKSDDTSDNSLFIPFDVLCERYPVLKKYKVLYPYYAIKCLIYKMKQNARNKRNAADDAVSQTTLLLSELGLI